MTNTSGVPVGAVDDWKWRGPTADFAAVARQYGSTTLADVEESCHARAKALGLVDKIVSEPVGGAHRDTKQMARDLGRGEAEKAFPRAKYKYVRDEGVTLQGWDGYALDIEDTTGAMVMMRTYIVKDRLYRMLVTAKPDMRSKTAALRFIDSLRLAETRQ